MTRVLGVLTLGACLLSATPAEAHLIAVDHGTINVVDDAAFTVLSVPTSSLHGADDNGDGVLDAGELERHETTLREEIDRRLAILDGATLASTVRIDLILSPQHDGPSDRANQVVVLKHARFAAPPLALGVRCDLFGAHESERALTITATQVRASGKESRTIVLTPGMTAHTFFPPAQPPVEASPVLAGGSLRAQQGAVLVGFLALAAVALSRTIRSRGGRDGAGNRQAETGRAA